MKIEKNIPIPRAIRKERRWATLEEQMEAGDSIGNLSKNEANCLINAIKAKGSPASRRAEKDKTFRVWKL